MRWRASTSALETLQDELDEDFLDDFNDRLRMLEEELQDCLEQHEAEIVVTLVDRARERAPGG